MCRLRPLGDDLGSAVGSSLPATLFGESAFISGQHPVTWIRAGLGLLAAMVAIMGLRTRPAAALTLALAP